MKLLLDHCVDWRLARHLPTHEVHTTEALGWALLRNGALLAQAAANKFDALLTTDQGMKYQQNLLTLPTSVLVIRGRSNRLADIVPLVPAIEEALAKLEGFQFIEVPPPA